MSHYQGSSQNKTRVSPDDFKRALNARDVEEARRCLEIHRFLVDKTIWWYGDSYPPLMYAVMKHSKLSDSGRSVLELVEIVRLLLDHEADINARDQSSYPRPGWTALHSAVLYNLVEVVELLLQYQAQVDVRNCVGCTPLFYCKSVEVARLLIAHGADINSKDYRGRTPVFNAEDAEVALLLIAHGADVKSKNENGGTPLFVVRNGGVAQLLIANGAEVNRRDKYGNPAWLYAMQRRWDLETLKVLVEHGVELQGEDGILALHLATAKAKLEIMEFLLDQGVPVNAKATPDGETPLHNAARCGCVRGIQLLLQRGADVNATDHHGKTTLAYIDSYREDRATKVAELLIEHGAVIDHGKEILRRYVPPRPFRSMLELFITHLKLDLNARDSDDSDTLAFGMLDRHPRKSEIRPIFMLLIEYGADVKAKHRQSDRTLLHFAAAGYNFGQRSNKEEFLSEVQLLLEKGSDVNAIDNDGFTPLMYASYYGHWNIVRMLADQGADVNTAHKNFGTPLSWACKENEESMVQLLLDAGAQVDYRLKNGDTALLDCVRSGLIGCATLLLYRGADIFAANREGQTPFLVACKQGWLEMIYCLIRLSSHHRRLGLFNEASYPSVSAATTSVA